MNRRDLRSTASDTINLEMVLASPDQTLAPALQRVPGVNQVEVSGAHININTIKNQELHPRILPAALENQAQILSFGPRESSLEDILLRLVETDASDVPEPKKACCLILLPPLSGEANSVRPASAIFNI